MKSPLPALLIRLYQEGSLTSGQAIAILSAVSYVVSLDPNDPAIAHIGTENQAMLMELFPDKGVSE